MNSPRNRMRSPNFSAGASNSGRPAPKGRSRSVRIWRSLGWLVLALVTTVLLVAATLWVWAGTNTSLAAALARAAQYMPAEQRLESRDVTGSLRSGGSIGWLRWSSPSLAVEVTDIRLGWQIAPLLQRRLELGEVQAARVVITRQTPATPEPPTPLEPLTQLMLPLQIGVSFKIDAIEWQGPPAVLAQNLWGNYRFDGQQHRLNIDQLALAQGSYTARVALDAQAPMALDAVVDGTVRTTVPGGGADLQLGAHATLQGTLATAAAQLQLNARIQPTGIASVGSVDSAASVPTPPRASAKPARGETPPASPAMQAQVQATLSPWQTQPLQAANATLQAVNLAALWPQAPVTDLHGTVQAGPSSGTATKAATGPASPSPLPSPASPASPEAPTPNGWAVSAQLRNDLPGPWDTARLPLSALQGSASYDGSRWTVPEATLQTATTTPAATGPRKGQRNGSGRTHHNRTRMATGSATLQGHFTPATGALEGQAQLQALSPAALHTALEAAPLSGRITAAMQGSAVRFEADIRAASRAPAASVARNGTLRIHALTARGRWQAAAKDSTGNAGSKGNADNNQAAGTLVLDRLMLDAQQARVEATGLRIALGVPSVQGQLTLTVPGASGRFEGQMAPRAGAGEVQWRWLDIERTQRWLTTLPFVGADLQRALQGTTAKGSARIDAQWKGGWETAIEQLQAATATATATATADAAATGSSNSNPTGPRAAAGKNAFEVKASLTTPQLDLTLPPAVGSAAAQSLQLRGVDLALSGNLAQATVALEGELRTGPPEGTAPHAVRATVQTRLSAGMTGPGQWQAQINALRLQAQDARRPGPYTLQLAEPINLTARTVAAPRNRQATSASAPAATASNTPRTNTANAAKPANTSSATATASFTLQASAGQARLTGPLPGTVTLRWQPVRVATGPSAANGTLPALQTQGTLEGLPLAWVDALGIGAASATAGSAAQPLLARLGVSTNLVLNGQWNVDTKAPIRANASLQRASGDLRILAGDATAVTAVQSSGQGTGAGAVTAIATEASTKAGIPPGPQVGANAAGPAGSMAASGAGTPAGVRQAEVSVQLQGEALTARLQWASERAGDVDATASTRLSADAATGALALAPNAPLSGTVRARLPDVGVWSALAPPGWRVRGTLDANATLSGTLDAPRWSGTLGADDMAVRSVVDGVELQGGRLRATLKGNQIDITEFRLQGGRGSGARIAGFSGNRTAAPRDGGTLTGTGRISWGEANSGLSGIAMAFQAEAKSLQVLVRADRQLSVSGQLNVQLQQGQISLRGKLTTDRATIILPDETAPSLGSDVIVRSAAKDRADQASAQAAAKANQAAAGQVEAAKPPDIAITLNLGRDFALSGHGITTRLTGEVDIRSSAVPGAPPRITGEVRTEEGRYRAWGQMLDVETGLIRFNGPYNNPSLDILALRPNIAVRAGVQVTGSAQAPRVKLYSDPELPDAEKLSWVVLGRSAAAGGAEAAVLQQAALALLGRNGGGGTANFASRLGLDEIGFKGPGTGDDASAAALTFGKRLSKDLYVTYERSLSGTLGTLYIFYDLTRRLTLRGQTGEKSAVDLIYTISYN